MSPIVSITSLSAARFLNGINSDSRMETNEDSKKRLENLYRTLLTETPGRSFGFFIKERYFVS